MPAPLLIIFSIGLLLVLVMLMIRFIKGPTMLDRILCVDALALGVLCIMCIWQVLVGTTYFFDAVLILSLIGFVTTVALAKYFEKGDIIG